MLRSEEVRKLAPEMDPLRMGMGWKVSDLSKPQVMVEELLWRQPSGVGTPEYFRGGSGKSSQ